MSTGYRIAPTTLGQALRCAGLKAHGHVTSNEFAALRLRGTVDLTVLKVAIAQVVNCHDSFRTDFPQLNGEYVQRVWQHAELEVRHRDLQQETETHRHDTLLQERRSEIQRPFDMEHAPLARMLLLQMQPEELIVAIAVDHLIIDTLSMGVFWRDLFAAYAALLTGTAPPAPPTLQFADFALWQRARLTEQRIEKNERYWRKTLAALAPPIRWRNGRSRPARFTYTSRAITTTFDATTTTALKQFAVITSTNLFAVLNAFFVLALARLSDARDILVHTAVANRRRSEFDRVIGFFAQPVLLRFRVADSVSVGELVRNCHRITVEAIGYSEIHLAMNKPIIGDPPDESYAFRQQVSHLHYSFIRPESLQVPGLRSPPELVAVEEHELPYSHDLVLCTFLVEDGIDLKLWYNTGVFDASSAQEVLDEFCALGARCASSRLNDDTLIRLAPQLCPTA